MCAVANAPCSRARTPKRHGHRAAHLDPLDLAERPNVPALDPRRYGFDVDPSILRADFISEALPDVERSSANVDISGIMDWPSGDAGGERSIEEVSKRLGQVYCDGVAFEVRVFAFRSGICG